ncbi:MAG: bga [Bacteroidetes bacterium]|nr:bga [Bacteroidota bacterium]
MRKLLLLIVTILLLCGSSKAQSFEIRDGAFMLNGKPMRIYGGEMHYARIPREYWQHRIQMAKAMGCNTLSIYVMWNYHQPAPDKWDWSSDNHDLRAFVELVKAEGMYIVLRPGPYVCAEWDFGGFPYWLVNQKLRSNDKTYLDSCRVYLQQVFKQVDGLFIEQGGNIIMTQVENEYGSFSFDMQFKLSHKNRKEYLENLAAIFREVGFKNTLFTCDGGIVPVVNFARLGHIKGLFPGTNDSKFLSVAHHTVRKFYNKKGPYYIPEEYAGWFTHWGDAHVFHRDVEKYKKHIEELLKTDFSFCYYMVHGGTNFGFWSGTNHRAKNDVWPVITSYDYGAPIDEAGNRTPLYDSLRAVYQRQTGEKLADVPAPVPSMGIGQIDLKVSLSFWGAREYVFSPFIRRTPGSFEQFKVRDGYMLFEKFFDQEKSGKLSTSGLTDYTLIYIKDSLISTIDRNRPSGEVPAFVSLNIPKGSMLRILIENEGRINFGKHLWSNDKGPINGIRIGGKLEGDDWMITDISPENITAATRWISKETSLKHWLQIYHADQPILYSGEFHLTDTADTYLDMHGFGKGFVMVNGHNLGRYWEIGPQFSLYVPGVWLKKGENEIVIFDQLNHKQMHSISATAKPVNR